MATLTGSTSKLINEDHILEENGSSSNPDLSTGVNSSAPLKAVYGKNKEKSRKQFLKNVRDLFNIDSTEFHFNDSIIFKTINDTDAQTEEEDEEDDDHPKESSATITDTNKAIEGEIDDDREKDKEQTTVAANKRSSSNSFRNSILFGESNNIKRFSSYSSSSFNLEEFSTTPVLTSKKEKDATSDATDKSDEETKEEKENNDLADKKTVIEILTKSASVERLLDLLCLTSSIFCSGLDEEDVKQFIGSDKLLESLVFKMDNGIFTVTFFATYRGFCSTTKIHLLIISSISLIGTHQ
ncbi:unnamed protein product [[Candida] boidinii]|nr:unnamed protein product [[Candida] boidinii]